MKTIIHKLLDVDKKVLLFLVIISIIGIITGSLFITILNNYDKQTIIESLNNFIGTLKLHNFKINIFNNLILNLVTVLIIWILGISIIGLPIVIFLIFYKSFILSFTLSSFIFNYRSKGLIYSVIYIFPHQIINLIVYIYLGVSSIKLSNYMIQALIYKKSINFKAITNKYVLTFVFGIIILIITTLYETYLMPYLLQKSINML